MSDTTTENVLVDDVSFGYVKPKTESPPSTATGVRWIPKCAVDDGIIDFPCVFPFSDESDLNAKLAARKTDVGAVRVYRAGPTGGVKNAIPPVTFIELDKPFVPDYTGLPDLLRESSESKLLSPLDWLLTLSSAESPAEFMAAWTRGSSLGFKSGHPDMGGNGSPQWRTFRTTTVTKLVLAKLGLLIPVQAGCFHMRSDSVVASTGKNDAKASDAKAAMRAKLLAKLAKPAVADAGDDDAGDE